jgi:hypothetical protein
MVNKVLDQREMTRKKWLDAQMSRHHQNRKEGSYGFWGWRRLLRVVCCRLAQGG